MTVDASFEVRVHRAVADRLTDRLRTDTGLSVEDERALTRELIASELTALAESAYGVNGTRLNADTEKDLSEAVFARLWGLGRLQAYVDDPDLANVHVNGCDDVWLVYRDGTKIKGEPVADSDQELIETIAAAARRLGRSEKRWDRVSWELHLQLPGGERLHGVLGLTGRPVITIRRHDFTIHRLDHLVALDVIDEGLAGFLAAAVRAKLNVIVAGGTNTGKTTMLRCLLNEIPPAERVVTVEDNLELGIDRFSDLHPDHVCWERRGANVEGHGEASLAECVKATLRQNPDRVIVGEIRGIEVVDMLRAMSQGNDGSMSSIHADSSKGALVRLGMYTAEAGLDEETSNKWIANAVDLIVHLGWFNGVRRVTSVREVLEAEARQVATNEVYRPGPTGAAVPAPGPAIRDTTLARLVESGFDADLLAGHQGG